MSTPNPQIIYASSYDSVRKITSWFSHIIQPEEDQLRSYTHRLIFCFLEENKLAPNLRACSEVLILEEKIQSAHYF